MSYDPCPKCHRPTSAPGILCHDCTTKEAEIRQIADGIFKHGQIKHQPPEHEMANAIKDAIKLLKNV